MRVLDLPRTDERAAAPADTPTRTTFISPRAVAAAWFVALGIASWINPATTEPIQPTALLTFLANVGALLWFGTLIAGAVKLRLTAMAGAVTGGVLMTGHLICGIDGHLPMTGSIWITQLMLIAAAAAVSALALATRR